MSVEVCCVLWNRTTIYWIYFSFQRSTDLHLELGVTFVFSQRLRDGYLNIWILCDHVFSATGLVSQAQHFIEDL